MTDLPPHPPEFTPNQTYEVNRRSPAAYRDEGAITERARIVEYLRANPEAIGWIMADKIDAGKHHA